MTWLTIAGLKRRDAPAPRKLFAGEILAFSRPSSRMYCTSSASESGSGRSMRSSLSASGRCLKRPSMLSSSSALSISARSLSAFGRYVTRKSLVRLAFDESLVGLLVEELGIVLHGAELDDPALAVRILVDLLVGLRETHAAQVWHPNSLSFTSDEAACKKAAGRPRPARPCHERPRRDGSPARTWPVARRPSRCCSQG